MKNTLTILLLTITALYADGIFAGYINDITNREITRRNDFVKSVTKEQQNFIHQKEIVRQHLKNYQGVIEEIKNQQLKASYPNNPIKNPQAIVFVSLGMPDLSLKQIIQDAERYQIPVVIRGLYENSFRKTAEKMFDLVKEKNKGGISINPLWFKKYNIKSVPAIVVGQDYGAKTDVVYGNIPLKQALSIIAERGEVSDIARDILNRSAK